MSVLKARIGPSGASGTVRDDEQKERTPLKSSPNTLTKMSSRPLPNHHPASLHYRHPALDAGSVLHKRDKRNNFNAFI
jgi:hypothetical protein